MKKGALKTLSITLVTVGALVASTLTASAALTFSPTAATITPSQDQTVTIGGGSANYFASASTNPSAVQLQITNNAVVFSTNASSDATADVTICDATNATNCGTITVTVSASGSNNNNNNSNNNNSTSSNTVNTSGPTLSEYSTTMSPNTSKTLNISGNGSNLFVSNNTNYNVVTPSIAGGSLILAANESGSATITICQSGGCNNLEVTVSGSSSSNNNTNTNTGGISFSQSNPSVAPGSTQSITVSGGTGIYNLSTNTNPTALVATLSNTTISMTGTAPGTAVLTICDSGNSCANVTVAVTAANTGTTTTPTPAPTTPTTNTGTSIPQSYAQTLLSQIITMENQLSQFQNQLALLKSSIQTLISGNFPTTVSPITATPSFSNLGHVFTLPLDVGDSGPEVTALQNRLTADGYYSGPVTGYFGPLTQAAVKRFQSANGVTPQGNVGPGTRAALNN